VAVVSRALPEEVEGEGDVDADGEEEADVDMLPATAAAAVSRGRIEGRLPGHHASPLHASPSRPPIAGDGSIGAGGGPSHSPCTAPRRPLHSLLASAARSRGIGRGGGGIACGYIAMQQQSGSLKYNNNDLAAVVHRALLMLHTKHDAVASLIAPHTLSARADTNGPAGSGAPLTLQQLVDAAPLPVVVEVTEFARAHVFLRRLFTCDGLMEAVTRSTSGDSWGWLRLFTGLVRKHQCEAEAYLLPLADVPSFNVQLDGESGVVDELVVRAAATLHRYQVQHREYMSKRRRSSGQSSIAPTTTAHPGGAAGSASTATAARPGGEDDDGSFGRSSSDGNLAKRPRKHNKRARRCHDDDASALDSDASVGSLSARLEMAAAAGGGPADGAGGSPLLHTHAHGGLGLMLDSPLTHGGGGDARLSPAQALSAGPVRVTYTSSPLPPLRSPLTALDRSTSKADLYAEFHEVLSTEPGAGAFVYPTLVRHFCSDDYRHVYDGSTALAHLPGCDGDRDKDTGGAAAAPMAHVAGEMHFSVSLGTSAGRQPAATTASASGNRPLPIQHKPALLGTTLALTGPPQPLRRTLRSGAARDGDGDRDDVDLDDSRQQASSRPARRRSSKGSGGRALAFAPDTEDGDVTAGAAVGADAVAAVANRPPPPRGIVKSAFAGLLDFGDCAADSTAAADPAVTWAGSARSSSYATSTSAHSTAPAPARVSWHTQLTTAAPVLPSAPLVASIPAKRRADVLNPLCAECGEEVDACGPTAAGSRQCHVCQAWYHAGCIATTTGIGAGAPSAATASTQRKWFMCATCDPSPAAAARGVGGDGSGSGSGGASRGAGFLAFMS